MGGGKFLNGFYFIRVGGDTIFRNKDSYVNKGFTEKLTLPGLEGDAVLSREKKNPTKGTEMIFKRALCETDDIIKVTDSLAPQNRLKSSIHVPLVRSRSRFRPHRHAFPEVSTTMGTKRKIFLSGRVYFYLPEPMDSVHCREESTPSKSLQGLVNTGKRHNVVAHALVHPPIVDRNTPAPVLLRD